MRDYNTSNKKSFIVIHDGLLSEISEAFIKLTGYSINELMGKSYLEVTNLLKFSRRSEFEHINKDFIYSKELDKITFKTQDEKVIRINKNILNNIELWNQLSEIQKQESINGLKENQDILDIIKMFNEAISQL